MKVICAWCEKVIRDGEVVDGQVSHGICDDCRHQVEKEFEAVKTHNARVSKKEKRG